jgi:PPM family protein phosphatase
MDDASANHGDFAPEVFGAAIQGQRSEQQDSIGSTWLPGDCAWLTIIADGLGGHVAGGVASKIAVTAFISTFVAARSAGEMLSDAFSAALTEANSQIADAQSKAPELSGMATTLVAAYISSQGIAWISVGDSPLWLLRSGTLTRLNEDHSLRAMVADGLKAGGNILQSALTGASIDMIDCRAEPVSLRGGDAIVVASDGLLTLSREEISDAVRKASVGGPEAVTRSLLKAVEGRRKPNQDNCSVIIALAPEAKTSGRVRRILLIAATIAAILAIATFVLVATDTGLIPLSIK